MYLLIKAEKKANFRRHTTCVLIRHRAMIRDQPPLILHRPLVADKYNGIGAKPQCLVKGYILQHRGHP